MDTVRSVVIKLFNPYCGAIPVGGGDPLAGTLTSRDVMLPLYSNYYGDYLPDTVHSWDFIEMEEGHALPFSKPCPTWG